MAGSVFATVNLRGRAYVMADRSKHCLLILVCFFWEIFELGARGTSPLSGFAEPGGAARPATGGFFHRLWRLSTVSNC
jgi:hypothetical protein